MFSIEKRHLNSVKHFPPSNDNYKNMEATAIIIAPSQPNPPSGQTQTNRTGDDTSFAPALSHAVAKRNKNDGPGSGKSYKKTESTKRDNTAAEKISQESTGPKKGTIAGNQGEEPSSSLVDKTTEKPSTDTAVEVNTNSKTDASVKDEKPTFLFTNGTSGYFLTTSEDLTISNLQKTVESVPDTLPLGKQDLTEIYTNILKNTASLEKDTSADQQLKNFSPITSLEKDTSVGQQLKNLSLSSPPQDTLKQTIQNSFGQQLNAGNGGLGVNSMLPTTGQDQSAIPSNNITNGTQTVTGTEQDTLLAQLQKILTANGADKSVIFQQSTPQNQAVTLESLSAPLYTLTDTSTQPATVVSDVSNDGLTASFARVALDKWFSGEKNTDRISSTSEDNQHLLSSKVDALGQKDTPKIQEKEAILQDAANRQQTALLNSSNDTAGNNQQVGQFSFGNTLVQNLQTGQHATGTTGSNYLTPWTAAQENNLINQVTGHFQINSGFSASKLSLKLYPEELGELKIDIQMKDGAIKASIVAQTEQVQQVLEKYIPKLRSFMEQQGLTVDDILVTYASDNVGRHDLFQEDFANNHDFSQSGKPTKSTSFSDLSFDKAFSEKSDPISGVNVTV
jgi:flagellar hook-length control protein FliK